MRGKREKGERYSPSYLANSTAPSINCKQRAYYGVVGVVGVPNAGTEQTSKAETKVELKHSVRCKNLYLLYSAICFSLSSELEMMV